MADALLDHSTTPGMSPASNKKAVVVGIYGVQGSGKTFLLNQLKDRFEGKPFAFYDGSQVIGSVVDGGLAAFRKMEEQEKDYWRSRAIEDVAKNCAKSGKVAVVAGHYMLWNEKNGSKNIVCTQKDLDTYTHIIYLNVPPEVIDQQRRNDNRGDRETASVAHLARWQLAEKIELRSLCRHHGILFSIVSPGSNLLDIVSTLLCDFKEHSVEYNLSRAIIGLDDTLTATHGQLETILVMDADKTLAAEDTGALFWGIVSKATSDAEIQHTLIDLFKSPLGYSYAAFRQAVLLYEETANDHEFDALCQEVADAVTIYPEVLTLLRSVAQQTHVGAVVVTCGLRRIWEKVLGREGLAEKVKVIGGGRIADGFVITEVVKSALVSHLQEIHHLYVWAFGDGPLDLGTLKQADQAVVVVGKEQTRSKSMEVKLKNAIRDRNFRARQVLLPDTVPPRLDVMQLPTLQLDESHFVRFLLRRRGLQEALHVTCAPERNAARLLATRMRDAAVAGPGLREAHRRVGWYLAIEHLADVLGVEECPIQHVQGKSATGHQLSHEQKTTIVALMRGGEPMAYGVNDAFPLAMFVHASSANDLKRHHLQDQRAVILVDSVVNTGKTTVEFVKRVRELHPTIRIIVVAGVIQAKCVAEGSGLNGALAPYGKVELVTLRISDNMYTGSGNTDTGNRLFNTVHLA
ncbi:MAG: hypothetical protein M1836_006778 [Candelina mexicana]|nr:MAG: hypothetical protein M1836_006778 [Candelina mexicana]